MEYISMQVQSKNKTSDPLYVYRLMTREWNFKTPYVHISWVSLLILLGESWILYTHICKSNPYVIFCWQWIMEMTCMSQSILLGTGLPAAHEWNPVLSIRRFANVDGPYPNPGNDPFDQQRRVEQGVRAGFAREAPKARERDKKGRDKGEKWKCFVERLVGWRPGARAWYYFKKRNTMMPPPWQLSPGTWTWAGTWFWEDRRMEMMKHSNMASYIPLTRTNDDGLGLGLFSFIWSWPRAHHVIIG